MIGVNPSQKKVQIFESKVKDIFEINDSIGKTQDAVCNAVASKIQQFETGVNMALVNVNDVIKEEMIEDYAIIGKAIMESDAVGCLIEDESSFSNRSCLFGVKPVDNNGKTRLTPCSNFGMPDTHSGWGKIVEKYINQEEIELQDIPSPSQYLQHEMMKSLEETQSINMPMW